MTGYIKKDLHACRIKKRNVTQNAFLLSFSSFLFFSSVLISETDDLEWINDILTEVKTIWMSKKNKKSIKYVVD